MRVPTRRWSGVIAIAGTGLGALGLLLAGALGGCAPTPAQAQAGAQVLKVSCPWDDALQPVAVQVVGAAGPAGATLATIDKLGVHPFVTNLCHGTPASITPASAADLATTVVQTIDLTGTKPVR